MLKYILVLIIAVLLFSGAATAHEQNFNETKKLLESTRPDCKSLTDTQLEEIGEYYMEQMHPGEAHEIMHKTMGLKEGSEAEEKFHITMARNIYCGEGGMMGMLEPAEMMNMMMYGENRYNSGMGMMMGRDMGNMYNSGMSGYNSGMGMMTGTDDMGKIYGSGMSGYSSVGSITVINLLIIILLIGLITLVFAGSWKLWKR